MAILYRVGLSLIACAFAAMACMSPGNIEGVAFTSGEQLNLRILVQMGVENESYIIDGQAPNIGIRYRSHYHPRAMVYVGSYGLSYQRSVRMNCMGIILPVADSAGAYQMIDTATFDFAKAVMTELTWLYRTGVLRIRTESLRRINAALDTAPNGGVQYWTHTNAVLGYNAWYTYDSVTGAWSEDGVMRVRNADLLSGCSVIRPGNDLPPNTLEQTAVSAPAVLLHAGGKPLAVRRLGNGAMVVFFPKKLESGRMLTAFDAKGAVVYSLPVPPGIQSYYIERPANNFYLFRLTAK
ncbi:MAG: hypothetical protein JW768_00180 [Chitinispirillaceae bacterium]|nr:hypothetical protein [Chitinispirillaceae bacterium]